MVNLSDTTLSPACISALNKGLSFVPTTYCDEFNAYVDFQKFFRTLRLKEFFSNTPTTACLLTDGAVSSPSACDAGTVTVQNTPPTKFRGKSTFIPPKNRNASIETYCRLVQTDMSKVFQNKRNYKVHDNLTKEERKALDELKRDNTIVVKPADKGGGVVLLNVKDYELEINRQLDNTLFYKKLKSNPTETFKKEIHDVLQCLFERGEINKNELDFMKVDHPITPVIYTLPKIHKNIENPPGRPIISGIGSLTEKISTFIDSFLRPHVMTLPSFVKDSMDMIRALKDIQLPTEDTMLATFDVESLYTNIPHDGGIEAVDFFLRDKHSNMTPSVDCIKTLTEIVLTKNFFMFKNDFFLQVKGTAMGSTMAPNYANLYVGLFEKMFVFNPDVNPFLHKILMYRRFIDDILVLWLGTASELSAFQDFLNVKSEHLRFTGAFNENAINFLDILISKDDGFLKNDLYTKPTDKNTMLHGKSYHPTSLKRSLPTSQFNRVRRVCSSDQDYALRSAQMSQRFRERDYDESWIQAASDRFKNMGQEECLDNKRQAKTDKRLTCVSQYSPLSNEFENIVRKHWPILCSDPALRDASFRHPPRFAYKRSPNISNLVVRADQPPEKPASFFSPIPDGNYRCAHCAQCNFTYKCNTYTHPHTGKVLKIKGVISCNSKNVIYMIKCPCGLAYIGKTTRCIKTRIAEHRSSIRLNDQKNPVAVHFNTFRHNLSTLKYIGIEQVSTPRRGGDIDNILLRREAYYIYMLNTLSPKGLNMEFDLKPLL